MANHKSAEKRIRANEAKRVRNRYQSKTTRDKLAKKNIIHWKKAANQKSKLTKKVNALA